ncbi:MAG: glycosyltransferase family 2 protein [Porphyromonadaceae bacterium]|nr:glycosyltransferase family 2 protein [Porphyromonadaceae bacterium]
MNDLVSIITPSYNTAIFLEETIQSVLNQTYKNWEMIIVDDCSTDNTDEIIRKFDDQRIKYYKNQENVGAAISRNTAISYAKGRWVAFLDSDDLWEKDKLEEQVKFMKENNISFTYTGYMEIDENSKQTGRVIKGPRRLTKRGMNSYCWPGCLTVMYDANAIGLVQIPDIKRNNDYALWIRISEKAECFLLDKILARYRKRAGSISNHSYLELIKWHYVLWRICERKSRAISVAYTIRNLFWGVIKKVHYSKNTKKEENT